MFTGTARVGEEPLDDADWRVYAEKYAAEFAPIGMTPEEYRASYSVPVRVSVERVRSW
ncbi:hypothetical protein ABIQ69_00905 [Agromyces sp. G08B096]|uniref:Uncharacterized protein n=1 Tax=Agromyces sp. G08B096 TaxID=3156399 RepID=A0AAU7WBL7_9MICO